MYKKLLVEAGGGIISRAQQSPQEESATLAIGLGGTGISCLRQLKKEVYNKLQPDDIGSAVPEYKHIKFLAVDTDKGSLGDDGNVDTLDPYTEFFDISCSDITSLLDGASLHLVNQSHLKWLKTANDGTNQGGLSILEASAGAGGVRQIGRLLLLQSSNSFKNKVVSLINAARRGLPAGSKINVMIFTGLGGGTGSGTFLDVCYIVQNALSEIGELGASHVLGFFFLPDINISNVANEKTQKYVRVNGFAAMKELDHCMSFETNGDEWNQQYEGFAVRTSAPPVKLAHLVTATNAEGATKDNGYGYAMHVVTDYVMQFLTKPYISENANANEHFNLDSHIANIKRHIEMVDKNYGACYDYCVLGASSYYVPYNEVSTYLASKIFEAFGNIDEHVPSENDLDEFVKQYGLTYESIMKNMRNSVPNVPNYEVDPSALFEECQGIVDSSVIPHLLVKFRDIGSKINGAYTENKKSMLENVENTAIEDAKNIHSLINKIRQALTQIAANYEKGPYYARELLHSVNIKSLDNVIDGYITTNQENLSMAQADLVLREETWNNTLRNFKTSRGGVLGNRRRACEAYVAAVRNYYVKAYEIDLYNEIGDLLVKLKKQINELYDQTFKIFADVLAELQETFKKNLGDLSNNANTQDPYEKKLMTIEELRGSLDDSVKAMRLKDVVENFIATMLSNPSVWVTNDENKITKAVTDFFLSELSAYTSMTIINYLSIKYDTNAPDVLKSNILSDILNPAYNEATPLFWRDGAVYQISDASKVGYCFVPEISAEIKNAAADLRNMDPEITSVPLDSSDRISILQFLCGVPMFGYKGVSNYFAGYSRDGSQMTGKHLYEGGRDPRNTMNWPDIQPAGLVSEGSIFMTYALKQHMETYSKAFDCKIVAAETIGTENHYKVYIYDEEEINNMESTAKAALEQNDKAALDVILEKYSSIPVASSRFVKKTSSNEGEMEKNERIVRDTVLASPVLIELIEKQLDLLERYNSIRAKVENAEGSIAAEALAAQKAAEEAKNREKQFRIDIMNFANAVCTGAIANGDDVYSYVYEKGDDIFSEKISLTDINTEPYGMNLPFYSAFVGYTALSEEDKAAVSQLSRKKIVESRDLVIAKKAEMIEYLKTNASMMANMANLSFPEAASEIKKFLGDISAAVANMMV